jgi:hypothetical protein
VSQLEILAFVLPQALPLVSRQLRSLADVALRLPQQQAAMHCCGSMPEAYASFLNGFRLIG